MGKTTFTGPVAGAYMPLYVHAATATTIDADDLIPVGMTYRVYGFTYYAATSSAGTVTVGSSGDTDGYLASKSVTAVTATYAAADGALTADGIVDLVGGTSTLRVVGGGTMTDLAVIVHGYVIGHTTDLNREGV